MKRYILIAFIVVFTFPFTGNGKSDRACHADSYKYGAPKTNIEACSNRALGPRSFTFSLNLLPEYDCPLGYNTKIKKKTFSQNLVKVCTKNKKSSDSSNNNAEKNIERKSISDNLTNEEILKRNLTNGPKHYSIPDDILPHYNCVPGYKGAHNLHESVKRKYTRHIDSKFSGCYKITDF